MDYTSDSGTGFVHVITERTVEELQPTEESVESVSGVKLGSACRLPLADSEFQDPIQIVRIRFEKRAYNDYYKLRKLIRGTNL